MTLKFSRRGMVKKYSEEWTVTPQSEEAAFHKAMEENPYDKTTPLVYADWLDDHGRPGLAELMRHQAERYEGMEEYRKRQWENAGGETGLIPDYAALADDAMKEQGPYIPQPVVALHERKGGHTDTEWRNRAAATFSTPYEHENNRDAISLSQVSLHNPNKKFYLQAWLPKDRARAVLKSVRSEGFPISGQDYEPHHTDYKEKEYLRHLFPQGMDAEEPPVQMSHIPFPSRRRYASEKPYGTKVTNILSQQPEGVRWMKPVRSATGTTWQKAKVNENLLPVLAGSRLAVVLHEIKDKFKHDKELTQLADNGLTGLYKTNGEDTFTKIRDKLLHHSQPISARLGLNPRESQRAKELAQNYNWHRVSKGLVLDGLVAEHLNNIASQRLKDRGEVFRSAHHVFGKGSGANARRGSDEQRQQLMNDLMTHLKSHKIGVDEQQVLNSMERLAYNEGAVSRLTKGTEPKEEQTGHLGNQTVGARNPLKPAWTPGKGGKYNVNRGIESAQFRRADLVRRYGLLDSLRGKDMDVPVLEGIRHTSHPNGKYDPNAHMATTAEHNALRHRLNHLGLLTGKKSGEGMPEYDARTKQDVDNWMKRLREHVNANVNDPASYEYLQAANRFSGGNVPMGILELSGKMDPLVKRVSGYEKPDTGKRDEDGLIDLNSAHDAPEEMETGTPVSDENIPEALPLNTPRQPRDIRKKMYQDIANHEDAGWSSEYPSAVEMLKDKYMIPHKEAVAHVANYRKLKGKPRATQPTTKRVWPPVNRKWRRKYALSVTKPSGVVTIPVNFSDDDRKKLALPSNAMTHTFDPSRDYTPRHQRPNETQGEQDYHSRIWNHAFRVAQPRVGLLGRHFEGKVPQEETHRILADHIAHAIKMHLGGSEDNTVYHFEHRLPSGQSKRVRIVVRGKSPRFDAYKPRLWRKKFGAYRAPAGGMIARGTHYRGGEMIPDMEGDFMKGGTVVPSTPTGPPKPKKRKPKFDPARLAKIRAKLSKISP